MVVTLPYLTLPVDALVSASGNNLSPNSPVLHTVCYLVSAFAARVFSQCVHKSFCLATSASLSVLGLPEDQFSNGLFLMLSVAVASKLESPLPDDV